LADSRFGEKTFGDYLHPDFSALGIALPRRSVVGISPAFRLRRPADTGRSAVFTGTATLRRQPPGPDRAGLQPRADTDGVAASAGWFLLARCQDPACP